MGRSTAIVDVVLEKIQQEADKAKTHAEKASDILLGELETDIATTPCEIVYEEDRVKLKHYFPVKKKKVKTPLLMAYALVNRETMLDLQPDRSVVKSLLNMGIDVYMIDWGYPTRKDRYLTIDDHVNGYMENIVDFIREREQADKINLMGLCMGGTFSLMYSSLHPEKVKNLITVVTATDFDTKDGLLHIWIGGIDADSMVETYGNLPGDLLNFGFLLMNPSRLMIDKYVGFMENMHNKEFVENFIRMEKWIFDSPDVPGETFRQFVNDCYHKNLFIQNKMKLGDQVVDLRNVTMPVLNIYGRFDHLVPRAACEKTAQALGSNDVEDVVLDTGHIGIFVSSKCQKELVPKIFTFLKDRDRVAKKKPRPKNRKGSAAKKATSRKSSTTITKSRPKKVAAKKPDQQQANNQTG